MPARVQSKLSHTRIAKLKTPGIYEDGAGIRLVIDERHNKCWLVRVTINDVRRQRGFDLFPDVSLEDASTHAADFRSAAHKVRDLASEKRCSTDNNVVAFRSAFDAFFSV